MTRADVEKLLDPPSAERLNLLEVLWESLRAETRSDTLSDKERKLVQERLAAYREAPDDLLSWQEVRQGIRRR